MTTKITLVVSIMLSAVALGQETETVKVPAEVKRFVKDLSIPIALESADLNGDGRKDYILVLERANPEMDDDGFPINQRPLLILVRGQDGKLTEAKRNEKIVSCSECGGSQGDPFQGFDVGPNTFTVKHSGGSGMRWSSHWIFNYSKADQTWRLVRSEVETFSSGDPEKVDKKVKRPEDFGKIDIADFDPKILEEKPE